MGFNPEIPGATAVTCPICGAPVGAPCLAFGPKTRAESHTARAELAQRSRLSAGVD